MAGSKGPWGLVDRGLPMFSDKGTQSSSQQLAADGMRRAPDARFVPDLATLKQLLEEVLDLHPPLEGYESDGRRASRVCERPRPV